MTPKHFRKSYQTLNCYYFQLSYYGQRYKRVDLFKAQSKFKKKIRYLKLTLTDQSLQVVSNNPCIGMVFH